MEKGKKRFNSKDDFFNMKSKRLGRGRRKRIPGLSGRIGLYSLSKGYLWHMGYDLDLLVNGGEIESIGHKLSSEKVIKFGIKRIINTIVDRDVVFSKDGSEVLGFTDKRLRFGDVVFVRNGLMPVISGEKGGMVQKVSVIVFRDLISYNLFLLSECIRESAALRSGNVEGKIILEDNEWEAQIKFLQEFYN